MALAPVAVSILALLGLIVCVALAQAYSYTLGAAIVNLAKWLASIRFPRLLGGFHPLRFAASALEKIDHGIRRALGLGIDAFSYAWHACIHYMAYWVHKIGEEIASLSHDTAQAIEGLATRDVPAFFRKRLAFFSVGLAAALAAVRAIQHLHLPRVERITKVVTHEVKTITRAVAVPDVGAIPRAIPGLKWLEREADYVRGEIKRLARVLTPAGIIGLVGATVFTRFDLGWLRCKGVGRVGRSLCGASGLIEALYAGALTAFAVTDLCRFALGIERAAETIRPLMLNFVDVENALFQCPSASFPSDFPLAAFSPTPVFDAVAL